MRESLRMSNEAIATLTQKINRLSDNAEAMRYADVRQWVHDLKMERAALIAAPLPNYPHFTALVAR